MILKHQMFSFVCEARSSFKDGYRCILFRAAAAEGLQDCRDVTQQREKKAAVLNSSTSSILFTRAC